MERDTRLEIEKEKKNTNSKRLKQLDEEKEGMKFSKNEFSIHSTKCGFCVE